MTMTMNEQVYTNGHAPVDDMPPWAEAPEFQEKGIKIGKVTLPADIDKKSIKVWLNRNIRLFTELDDPELFSAVADLIESGLIADTAANNWAKTVKSSRPKSAKPPKKQKSDMPDVRGDRIKENIQIGLDECGYSDFKYNEFSHMIYALGKEIDDGVCAAIRVEMRNIGFEDMSAVQDYYFAIAKQNAFNPIKQYLEGIVWDGKDHLSDLLSHITFENDPVLVYDKARPEFLTPEQPQSTADQQEGKTYCKASYALHLRWLAASIARVYNPKAQNFMPVLDGPPGIGKSYYVRFYHPDQVSEYCAEQLIDPDNRELDRLLATRWLSLEDELDGLTRKKDRSEIKAIVTQEKVTFRIPYAKEMKSTYATCNFYGTINAPEEGFLVDPEGNRRFGVMRAIAIDQSYSEKVNIDQVWAQVYALWKASPNVWRLTPEESTHINQVAAQYTKPEIVEDALIKYFDIDKTKTDWRMLSLEIKNACRRVGIRESDRSIETSVGNYLKSRGIRKQQNTDGSRSYVGIKLKAAIQLLWEQEDRAFEYEKMKMGL